MRGTRASLFIFFLLISVAGCGEGDRNNVFPSRPSINCTPDKFIEITTNIPNGMVMQSGCYRIKANLYIDNGTLQIMPNTVVEFATGRGIEIVGNGALNATGTPDQPILFTGQSKQRGSWNGIRYHHIGTTNNAIKYATIEYGGGYEYSSPPIQASVTISGTGDFHPLGVDPNNMAGTIQFTNNSIENSSGYGMYIGKNSGLQSFQYNLFRDYDKTSLIMFVNNFALLSKTNAFMPENGKRNRITLIGGTVGKSANMTESVLATTKTVIPAFDNTEYFVTQLSQAYDRPNIYVASPTIIEPGVNFIFDNTGSLVVSTVQAYLEAIGSPQKKITFSGITGTQEVPGSWKGIIFRDTNNPNNVLDYVDIKNGGMPDTNAVTGSNLRLASSLNFQGKTSVAVRNSSFTQSNGYGIQLTDFSLFSAFSNNVITQNTAGPIFGSLQSFKHFDLQSTYSGNFDKDYVTIDINTAGIPSADSIFIPEIPIPYAFTNTNLSLRVYGALTINPGATIKFGNGKGIVVSGPSAVFIAQGTPQKKVRFSGLNSQPGDWTGISFENASDIRNRLENAIIEHGGAYVGAQPQANIALVTTGGVASSTKTTVTLQDVEISRSLGYGIYKEQGSNLIEKGSISFISNTLGDRTGN